LGPLRIDPETGEICTGGKPIRLGGEGIQGENIFVRGEEGKDKKGRNSPKPVGVRVGLLKKLLLAS